MAAPHSNASTGFFVSVLAVVLLAIPAVATLMDIAGGTNDARSEAMARTPVWGGSADSLKKFAGDLRYYVKQRFAFKDQLITANSLIKTSVFNSMPYTKVVAGEDGFLFLADSEATDYHQRIDLLSNDELAQWQASILAATHHLKNKGVVYQLFVAPNKHSLYPEKLPQWVSRQLHEQSRLTQLLMHMQGDPVGITYALDALRGAKKAFPHAEPFFKTDTHWNEYGAAVATLALLKDLGIQSPGQVEPQAYAPDKAGDLARMIGQQYLIAESGWALDRSLIPATCRHQDGSEFIGRQTDPLKFRSVHCDGGVSNGLRVVVFMDSFGVGLIPFLGSAFEEVTFVWQYGLDFKLIDTLQPDIVIHQLVERKLQTLKPDDLFGALPK